MALDEKGIYLAEVEKRYPRGFQPLGYDVLMDVDAMRKPKVIPTFELCVNAIVTLLKMKPGQYPSIPELGLDIEQYLFEYTDDKTLPTTIKSKLNDQLNRLDLSGVEVDVFYDKMSDGSTGLVVTITGDEYLTYHETHRTAIVGITYDQLNRLYTRIRYRDTSNQN